MVVSRKCDTSYGEELFTMGDYTGVTKSRSSASAWFLPSRSRRSWRPLRPPLERPDMIEFTNASKRTQTFTELKSVVQRNLGKADLIDHRSNKWPSVTRSTFRAQVGAVWCEGVRRRESNGP